jgi:ComF family protein
MLDILRTWSEAAANLVYPALCQICRAARAEFSEGYVCRDCWEKPGNVEFILPPFCRKCGLPFEGEITVEFTCPNCTELDLSFVCARSAVKAKGAVLEAIHRYKYAKELWFEEFLSELLLKASTPFFAQEKYDMIVPVPLHPKKEREREFNQAERLARRLASAVDLPVVPGVLQRDLYTVTQTLLNRKDRARNVAGAFRLKKDVNLTGKSVVLVDDVFTTGATTNACAKTLLSAGADRVVVWTVARGL